MSATRTELETTLHRMANRCECELSDIFHELLVDSRTEALTSLAWSGARFIEALREVRDGKEGAA